MSFRVKTTHKLLQPNNVATGNVEKNQLSVMSLLDDSKSVNFLDSHFPTSTQPQQENRPRGDSSKGLAIRIVSGAMADHM
jgi:hypothetical protein